MRVLVVQGDDTPAESLLRSVRQLGAAPECAADAAGAWQALAERPFDLLLLDLAATGRAGLNLIARVRAAPAMRLPHPKTSILVTAAAPEVRLRLDAFNTGADAYVAQPVQAIEALAVIRALARRRPPEPEAVLTCGSLRTDPDALQVQVGDRQVDLSAREFSLLRVLLLGRPGVVSRPQLQAALGLADGSGALDLCVHKLRRKIGPAAVQTVHGRGYRLSTEFEIDTDLPVPAGSGHRAPSGS